MRYAAAITPATVKNSIMAAAPFGVILGGCSGVENFRCAGDAALNGTIRGAFFVKLDPRFDGGEKIVFVRGSIDKAIE